MRKKLAENTKLNLLSKGNMTAPTAYLAHINKEIDNCTINLDIGDHYHIKSKVCTRYVGEKIVLIRG